MSNPYEVTEYRHEVGGTIRRREYRCEGVLHRDERDGPAVELFYEDGTSAGYEYWKEGERHREGGPALAHCFDDHKGALADLDYYQNGHRHRSPDEGPAVERFNVRGDVVEREFWLLGSNLTNDVNGLSRPGP